MFNTLQEEKNKTPELETFQEVAQLCVMWAVIKQV